MSQCFIWTGAGLMGLLLVLSQYSLARLTARDRFADRV